MSELETQRRLTRAFIDQRGAVEIAPIPRVRQSNGAGGWRLVDGLPRATIRATLIPATATQGPTPTAEGEADAIDFILVAEFGAVVAEDDYWMANGYKYVVNFVAPPNGYEVKAEVTRHGT